MGERVDVDRADLAQLSRLPRVGLGLAKGIVADRNAHGPFGSLEGLDRVSGVGPGLLKLLGPHVVFSGAGGQRDSEVAAPLDINTASATELDALPGIGPTRAAAIVQYRQAHGPFASVEQLLGVPGFGPAAVARVKQQVTAR
jgi:competence ComEA-like helix-hairpin-helix protein